MLIDFDPATAITLIDACKTLRSRRGQRLNAQVAVRYALRGCRVAGGKRLILPTVKLGGVRWTMPQWVDWWQRERARLSGPVLMLIDERRERTARQASAGHRRACERLTKMGFRIGGAA